MHGYVTVPSPASATSFPYVYTEPDRYLDRHASESQSELSSPYDMSGYIPGMYPSPEHDGESPEASAAYAVTSAARGGDVTLATAGDSEKAPAKRKRENRYKNAPPSVLSRRRAQNRASQRAYRERKDQRIKDLEQLLSDARQRNETLTSAFEKLQNEYWKLKASDNNNNNNSSSSSFHSSSGSSSSNSTATTNSCSTSPAASSPTSMLATGYDPLQLAGAGPTSAAAAGAAGNGAGSYSAISHLAGLATHPNTPRSHYGHPSPVGYDRQLGGNMGMYVYPDMHYSI